VSIVSIVSTQVALFALKKGQLDTPFIKHIIVYQFFAK
jgi:hypothetical protein